MIGKRPKLNTILIIQSKACKFPLHACKIGINMHTSSLSPLQQKIVGNYIMLCIIQILSITIFRFKNEIH